MTEPKKAAYFPYIVNFKDPNTSPMRWKPKVPDSGLETAMIPAYQRGGVHGDFQQATGRPIEYELFIPLTAINFVETRASFEKRQPAPEANNGEG